MGILLKYARLSRLPNLIVNPRFRPKLIMENGRNHNVIKRKYFHRRLRFTSASIETFNPIVCEIEETTQILTGNHAALCYFGNIENVVQATTTVMDNDFDPITAFDLSKKGLKIMQLNIRSLKNKFEQIKLLLYKQSIGILALTETWLDNSWSDIELNITGYNAFRKDHKSSAVGGGVMIYTHNSMLVERRRI